MESIVSTIDEVTRDEEVAGPRKVRPHLVLLGAGASRAAFPDGERSGMRLPLMKDFAEIVPVKDAFKQAGIPFASTDFEATYSALANKSGAEKLTRELERIIFLYFNQLALPDSPTIYNSLVLSLRDKDVIATFNWDPFLIQAYRRSVTVTKSLPRLLFLHGNVAHGYCQTDQVSGVRRGVCSRCGRPFTPDKLVFPVANKNYSADPSIAAAWRDLRTVLQNVCFFTIFGYGAPTSDADAIQLMADAWGFAEAREFEEIEIIDVRPMSDLRQTWGRFIHTHHFQCHANIMGSFLFNHPRRSVEAFTNQFIYAKLIENNPPPSSASLDELHQWFKPLVRAEETNE